ncbi:MAG: Trm112 family protein [Armatimonadota bacterium]|nr:Trm112 family protein [Armatimonadota bacterium]
MVDQKMLDILACPACDDRPPVRLEGDELICDKCGRAYPIRDDMPIMLIDEARLTREQPGGGG